jgi:Skp family chaperone for outer membrane proteins
MKTSRPGASSLRIVAAFLCAIAIAPASAQIQLQAPADPPPQPPQQQQPQPQQRPAQTPRQQPPARPAQQPAQQQAPAAQPQQPLQPRLPAFPTELPAPGAMFVILDGRLIMSQSNAALALRQQAERQNQILRTDVQKQEEEFRNAQAELQRQQRGQVPQDQLEKRARDLQKRMSDAQTKLQERTRGLDRVFAEAEQRIYQAMIQATVELAQERNYQVIFDKAQVVVVQNQYDVTGEILNRVNQRLPSVQLQMPAN